MENVNKWMNIRITQVYREKINIWGEKDNEIQDKGNYVKYGKARLKEKGRNEDRVKDLHKKRLKLKENK